jgi:hypothetical protein
MEVAIPSCGRAATYRGGLLEPRRRAERALVAVVVSVANATPVRSRTRTIVILVVGRPSSNDRADPQRAWHGSWHEMTSTVVGWWGWWGRQ